jgi:hypothetical protein
MARHLVVDEKIAFKPAVIVGLWYYPTVITTLLILFAPMSCDG